MPGPPPLSATWQQADELRAQGDFAGARDLLEPAADVAAIRLGPDDRAVVETQRRLATVHRELGELASARRVLEEALDGGILGLGEADPLILVMSAELGAIADELGNKHEARRNLARVARYGPAVLGADHPYVRTAQRYLGADAPRPAAVPQQWRPVGPGVYRSNEPPQAPKATLAVPEAVPPDAPFALPDRPEVAQPLAAPPQPDPLPPLAPPDAFVPSAPPPSHLPVTGTTAGWAEPVWDETPTESFAAVPRRSRGGWWIAAGVVVVALLAVAVVAVVALTGRSGPAARGNASPSAPAPTAPRDVQIRDDGASVTLTWTDPATGSVPFVVAGGRAGEDSRAFQTLPAGQTAYTVNGLNPTLDYCFTVVAIYNTDTVATSDPVCTDRRHEPGPSPSR